MVGHWSFIAAAYGVALAVLLGYRLYVGRQLRAAEERRVALAKGRS